MRLHYFRDVFLLWLSIAVAFAMPVIEAFSVKHINFDFLGYLAIVVPLATIISTSTRIYAQSDVYTAMRSGRPDIVGAVVRTTLVSSVIYLPVVSWLVFATKWPNGGWLWPVLLSAFLFSSVLQAPRFVIQAMAAGYGTSAIVLRGSIAMVLVAAFANGLIVTVLNGDTALTASIAANLASVLLSNLYIWRQTGNPAPTFAKAKAAIIAFDSKIIRTISFAVAESLSYNAFFYVFIAALLVNSDASASNFGFLGSLCLLAVSWRVTYSLIAQSLISSDAGVSGKGLATLWLTALGHVFGSLGVVWLATNLTGLREFEGEFLSLVAINIFGTFNQIALAGLRARNAMGKMAMISMASNAAGALLIVLWGADQGVVVLLMVIAVEEAIRATISTVMLAQLLRGDSPRTADI